MTDVTATIDESQLAAEIGRLFRVAYRLSGNVHDAEDLVQDVCERALSRAPDFAGADDCRRWLLRVLYNRFIDGRRQRQRSPIAPAAMRLQDAAAAADAAPDPEAAAAAADAEAVLEQAWARLEPGQQMLLTLRAEGYDIGEIAAIAQIDKPALSSRLHRARSSLARFLEEEEPAQPWCAISEKAR